MSSIQLEDLPDRVTEWSSANNTYRFTYVAPGEWDVHRAHDIDYAAHLTREGDKYHFRVEDGNPAASGRTLSLEELEDLLL
ncbi:hypothetical protein [Microbacterium sp. K24]|jgi:hypothetical protein|uniref:hypothetical protein n=1 Tax=Microbacterium sp. K24 TaxID=2305446 RepID=UPI00109C4FB0|nr:hypothetical protein [Microbacterium sp. K24]